MINDKPKRTARSRIIKPAPDLKQFQLKDVLDLEAIEALLDDFFQITGIGMALLDTRGDVIISRGWSEICTDFHRKNPETSQYCRESDQTLTSGIKPGSYKLYRCKNHMWDMATPIYIGDRFLGNFFIGQFFFEDETIDEAKFRKQARKYGFDEEAYISALYKAPRLRKEVVELAIDFYTKLIVLLTDIGQLNLQIVRREETQKKLNLKLREEEEKYRSLVENLNDAVFRVSKDLTILYVSPVIFMICGYTPEELIGKPIFEIVHSEDHSYILKRIEDIIDGIVEPSEYRLVGKNGNIVWVWSSSRPIMRNGQVVGLQGVLTDITKDKEAAFREREHLQELEIMNKVMVDRELKMVELKKEINGLLVKSGQKPRYKLPENDGGEL